jgi:cytochrome c peroxidase
VPSLRNVAISGPYFHNGSIKTLRDAVAFYATRDTDTAHWYPRQGDGVNKFDDLPDEAKANVNIKEVPYDRRAGQKPRLSWQEVDAIVAFLNTLTDKGMK